MGYYIQLFWLHMHLIMLLSYRWHWSAFCNISVHHFTYPTKTKNLFHQANDPEKTSTTTFDGFLFLVYIIERYFGNSRLCQGIPKIPLWWVRELIGWLIYQENFDSSYEKMHVILLVLPYNVKIQSYLKMCNGNIRYVMHFRELYVISKVQNILSSSQ